MKDEGMGGRSPYRQTAPREATWQAVLVKEEGGVKSTIVEWIPEKIKPGAIVKVSGVPGEFVVQG